MVQKAVSGQILHLELAQLPELVAPIRVKKIIISSSFKLRRCIETTWLFLVLAVAISSSLVLALLQEVALLSISLLPSMMRVDSFDNKP